MSSKQTIKYVRKSKSLSNRRRLNTSKRSIRRGRKSSRKSLKSRSKHLRKFRSKSHIKSCSKSRSKHLRKSRSKHLRKSCIKSHNKSSNYISKSGIILDIENDKEADYLLQKFNNENDTRKKKEICKELLDFNKPIKDLELYNLLEIGKINCKNIL